MKGHRFHVRRKLKGNGGKTKKLEAPISKNHEIINMGYFFELSLRIYLKRGKENQEEKERKHEKRDKMRKCKTRKKWKERIKQLQWEYL